MHHLESGTVHVFRSKVSSAGTARHFWTFGPELFRLELGPQLLCLHIISKDPDSLSAIEHLSSAQDKHMPFQSSEQGEIKPAQGGIVVGEQGVEIRSETVRLG